MDEKTIGLIGAIVGSMLGILGGAIGTYVSLKRAAGPRERAFVIKTALFLTILIVSFLISMLLTPHPYRHLLWIPYVILLSGGIQWGNRMHARVREEEAQSAVPQQATRNQ
jgi:hypothetical protein